LELIPSSTSRITFMPPVPDDPSRRRPDISRAMSELGWEPHVPLRDGIEKTVGYFRQVTSVR
jgi:nucleoside-diphosphate-sugar epimerase